MSDAIKMLQNGYADLDWLGANFAQLQSAYDGEFVAVKNGRVVAHARSSDALLASLKRMRISAASTIIKHVSTVREIL